MDGAAVRGGVIVQAAVTGIGLVTPLGCEPEAVLDRILQGRRAFRPASFGRASACAMFAPVDDFDAARYFPENKTLRLMNRDAQMAVVAARLAMCDAAVVPGELYPAEEIALYGATGLCGMPPTEIQGLLRNAAAADGSLDLQRFGQVALRRIRPVLSFKILANMPICFVSIFETLRGPNAVYAPWEGQAAQAIAAGVQAIVEGEVPCAVVGGCDVKTHALAFGSFEQLGLFGSWRQYGTGCVPGEGAAFLVLEERVAALRRGARIYAVVERHAAGSVVSPAPNGEGTLAEVVSGVIRDLDVPANAGAVLAGDGDVAYTEAERIGLESAGVRTSAERICPKSHLGNLFAAAAAVQVALAALLARRRQHEYVLANCFGHGTEQAAFLLGSP
jgi:3-oxoacyl-[acyl-carrier-protein] synthase II